MKKKLSIVSAITLTLILSLSTVAFASSGQAAGSEVNLAQDAEQGLSDRGAAGVPQPLSVQNAIRYKSGPWTGVISRIETANPPVSPFHWSWVRAFVQHYSGGHNYFGEFGWEKEWPYGPRYRIVCQSESGRYEHWGNSVDPSSLHYYQILNTDGDTVWQFRLDWCLYMSRDLSFSAATRVGSGGEVSHSGTQMGLSLCMGNCYRHDSIWTYYSGVECSDPGYHADKIGTYAWRVWGPNGGKEGVSSSTDSGEANTANWEGKEVTTGAEAITIALEVARMHGLVGDPISMVAGQMTHAEFEELAKQGSSHWPASDTIVWVVSIKGNVVVTSGPPMPDGTPFCSEYDNMYVVLEANTGIPLHLGACNPGYEPEWPF